MNHTSTVKSRWGVASIFAINGFLYANWVSRLPRLQELYALDHGTLGLVLLAASIGALLAMPLTGRIIVQTGSDRITSWMLVVFCLLTVCIPLLSNYYGLGLVLFFVGASTGSLDVAMNAQAVIIEQRLNKPVMSSFHAVFSAGMMLGAGSGALFNYLESSLSLHLLITSLLSLLLAFYAIQFLIREDRNSEEKEEENEPNIFAHPALLLLGMIAFCCMLGEGAMADWTTNYLEKVSNGGRYWSPFGLVAFSTAMMLGRFAGDRARQKLGDTLLLKISAVIATLGMIIAVAWPVITAGIFGFFLVGLGLATIVPIAYSTAAQLPGLSPGVGISMVTTIGYAGFLVGPPVIGFISDWQGLRIGMSFVLFLFVLMLLLNFWDSLVKPKKRKA